MLRPSFALLALAPALLLACSKDPQPAATTAPAASAASAATAGAALSEGAMAPDVELALQDGRKVKLSSFRGKNLALYFYPKDNTPGCTVEAQGIRDAWADLQKAGVEVIGVSTQDEASHKAFIEQEKLPFPLAVDAGGKIAQAFGVPLNNGVSARQTFLIGKDGKLLKVWRKVTPQGHAGEILASAR
jgi:thioredoxin-dependent peroxiredoxin